MNYLSHVIGISFLLFFIQVNGDQNWCKDYGTDYCFHVEFKKLCPVLCENSQQPAGSWSGWTFWGSCSRSCGGSQSRYRTCSNGKQCPMTGGSTMATYESESRDCNSAGANCNVPVHGKWTSWTLWSECSASCGNGQRFRTRTCTNPTPQHNGQKCTRLDGLTGYTAETQNVACSNNQCPVNGRYTPWSVWTTCSQSCGNGRHYQKRCCTNPAPAHGGRNCNGESIRTKACQTNSCPVNGNWGQWTRWNTCDKTCGFVGVRKRFRVCNDPPDSHGGKPCPGNAMETAVCGRRSCPVDGGFSDYTEWSDCSDKCNGVQYRTRCCNNPTPMNHGKPCTEKTGEIRPCKSEPTSCAIVPEIEREIVTTEVAAADNKNVQDVARVDKEYTVQLDITLDAVPTAGNIILFENTESSTKGKVGPAIDLVKTQANQWEFEFFTYINDNVDSVTSNKGLQVGPTSYTVTIRQLLENGVVKRDILIDQEVVDSKINNNPIEHRDAVVYMGKGTAAKVKVKDFKFYNNPTKVCPRTADVVYILDSSISVAGNFDKEKKYAQQLARGFPISTTGSRGAAIVYSSQAQVVVNLGDTVNDMNTFMQAFAAVPLYQPSQSSGNTRIDTALFKAKEHIFLQAQGDRSDVPNLAILLVEGDQTPVAQASGNPVNIANEMRAKGIKIFVIGIGDAVSTGTLRDIAGGEYNYIRAVSWEELGNEEFIGESLDLACRVLTDQTEVVFSS